MTLVVHTARVTYGGGDRLDITRKSDCAVGKVFAPSWAILRAALVLRSIGTDESARDKNRGEQILTAQPRRLTVAPTPARA